LPKLSLEIFCTEPVRIPLAGKIDICAFDKTGTLTLDKLEVHSVIYDTASNKTATTIGDAVLVKPQIGMVLGGCHTVVVHEGELMGDPIEKLFFDSTGWKYNLSMRTSYNGKRSSQQIVNKFTHPFRSDLKRMCTICKVEGFSPELDGNFALVKGAPEILGSFFKSRPENYDEVSVKMMKEGYRVLALAYKRIDNFVGTIIPREELEKDLEFAALLVLNCPMKIDTEKYITMLREANFKNIMITGDNMFTAAKTGQNLLFGSSKVNLFLRKISETEFAWFDIHDKIVKKSLVATELESLAKTYCLCVEGAEMKELFNQNLKLLREVIRHTVIFARVSPDQKELIVTELKEMGFGVLMCGDGTNDVGGLKKSDVGIALVGLKNEPTDAEKNEVKEKKKKAWEEAIRTRNMQLLKQLQEPQPTETTEFKSGDACIAAPFTNKYSNSLKCGKLTV
jgi:cation-transporting ATPase 13A1